MTSHMRVHDVRLQHAEVDIPVLGEGVVVERVGVLAWAYTQRRVELDASAAGRALLGTRARGALARREGDHRTSGQPREELAVAHQGKGGTLNSV